MYLRTRHFVLCVKGKFLVQAAIACAILAKALS